MMKTFFPPKLHPVLVVDSFQNWAQGVPPPVSLGSFFDGFDC